MMIRTRLGWVLAGAVILLPFGVSAQEMESGEDQGIRSWQEDQLADVEDMKGKFLALAEAFSEENYDWRPMDGVRSVRDVMALIAAEGMLFPTLWGVEAPEGVAQGFGAEMARVGALSKAETISEIERGFDHFLETTAALDDAARAAEANWFGRPVTVNAAIALAIGDMHEHLGQSIAYARTNHIVPPWSR